MGCIMKCMFSDKSGTGHHRLHNITTIVNIPLVAWFIIAIFTLQGASYEAFAAWISGPINFIFAAVFIINTLLHFNLELEDVFVDYISDEARQKKIISMMKFFSIALGALSLISLIKIGLLG